jgi:hypothetical protein
MKKQHTERFKELISRKDTGDCKLLFTDEEIIFLGKEDIVEFGKRHPAYADWYMEDFC